MNPLYQVVIHSVNSAEPESSVNVIANIPESFMYDTAAEYEAPFSSGLTGNRTIDIAMRLMTGKQMLNQAMTAQVWMGSNQSELGLELEFHAKRDPYKEVFEPIMSLMKLVTPSIGDATGVLTSPGPRLDAIFRKAAEAAVDTSDGGFWSKAVAMFKGEELMDAQRVSMSDPSSSYTQGNGDTQSVQSTTKGLGNAITVENLKQHIENQISIQIGGFALFSSVVVTNVQKTYQSAVDANTGLPFYARVNVRFKPLFMVVQGDLPKMFPMRSRANTASPSIPDNSDLGAFAVNLPGLATPTPLS